MSRRIFEDAPPPVSGGWSMPARTSAGLHRFAVVTLTATFVPLFPCGLVRRTRSRPGSPPALA